MSKTLSIKHGGLKTSPRVTVSRWWHHYGIICHRCAVLLLPLEDTHIFWPFFLLCLGPHLDIKAPPPPTHTHTYTHIYNPRNACFRWCFLPMRTHSNKKWLAVFFSFFHGPRRALTDHEHPQTSITDPAWPIKTLLLLHFKSVLTHHDQPPQYYMSFLGLYSVMFS